MQVLSEGPLKRYETRCKWSWGLRTQHDHVPQAVTVALEWRNLTYTVPVGKGKKKSTKMILDRLTGVAPPGHLLAIMGPTGALLPSIL